MTAAQTPAFSRRHQRGSALMLMIWAVLVMAVTVMGVVEYVRFSAEEATLASADFQTLYLAECGLAVGLHPEARRGDPMLHQSMGTDSGFDVLITYEGARIPVNFLVDDRLRESVYNLFVKWGVSPEDATTATDSLADWIDSDDDQRPQGAESEYYKGLGYYDWPRQTGFVNVDEMLLARGMAAVDRVKPDWREYFSVYGDGTIDLRTAGKDVLLAITGSGENDVERFLRTRDGADGIQGTDDDRRVSTSEAVSLLGMDKERYAALQSILTTDDRVRRVASTGRFGEKRRTIVVIARRGDDNSLTYMARMEE